MNKNIKELLTGYAIGAANIIPGVSGGTFLLIFGLYERVINALNGLSGEAGKELLYKIISAIKSPTNREKRVLLFKSLVEKDILFMAKLGFGAVFAILSLSSLMKYLLANQHTYTFALFFGLILASLVVPMKMFKKFKFGHIIPMVFGALLTIWIASSVNPSEKIMSKSERYETRYIEEQSNIHKEEKKLFKFQNIYTGKEYGMIAVAGAVAISAMVLPGVSGSLVLILMGQYFAVITAISGAKTGVLDHFLFLGVMSIGMLLGIGFFVKIIHFVFEKAHDYTMGFLVGLIGGSLYALWPFKASAIVPELYIKNSGSIEKLLDSEVFTNINILPMSINEGVISSLFVVVGILCMIPFIKNEK